MKKNLYFLSLIVISFGQNTLGQIPNGGFEEWESVHNYEQPLNWTTNQDSNYVKIEKDTFAAEGDFSLKLLPSAYSGFTGECLSYAMSRTKLDSPIGANKSLTFYVRSIPDTLSQSEYVYMEVFGAFYESGNYVDNYEWKTSSAIEDFTKIEIPITNPNVDSITHSYIWWSKDWPC